ncbi:hypothetical protein PAHAL_3G250200 [Panicum hallii]|jgi:hypothetical protein|uniref:KIB1-4 beta-propeller domain-containing protein n=1 Tax=Panicum hallii TaxID=206008 RepID=A0A2S3HBC1_9POAL|nr:uncharacterized protein LOC112886288 [Panicum hallii]PAN19107.1 hypothetical protein PAHAL_3G250200 [Panicum hallii]
MDWSDLPADLVAAVADRLGTELADLARFRSVCRPWRSGSAAHAARLRVPLLLIPMMSYDTSAERLVWSLADDRLREAPLPEARGGHSFVFASHHGWILTVVAGDGGLKATLVYHFTGVSEQLPRLPSSFGGKGGRRVTLDGLSWDRSPHGVVVSPGKGAFFCRPGDGSWRSVGCPSAAVTSVTACDGALYLFDRKTCSATVVDAETLAVVAVIEAPTLEVPGWERKEIEANLVVCPDEVILLVRSKLHHPWCSGWPSFCKAFRADPRAVTGGRSPSWSEVAGIIGDRAVFVDNLRAFCVEANDHNGLRRNCVYVASSYHAVDDDCDYTLDRYGRMYSVAVLDFANHTTESLSFGSLVKLWSPGDGQCSSWLMPSCCSLH